jgi:hypothetical protein
MMTIDEINAFFDSPEGKESLEKFAEKLKREQEHKDRWIDRMWNHIKDDVDGSIEHLGNWYCSDKYRDREYKMGYEPREKLLWVLLGVAEKYGSEVGDEYEIYANSFTGEMYKLGSYIIQVMHGQGSVIIVEKIRDEKENI